VTSRFLNFSTLGIIILAATIGFSFAYADEECDQECREEFGIPDYNKPSAQITFNKESYTWSSQVRVIIYAPAWNAEKFGIDSIGGDADHAIQISTRGHSIKPYSFVELSPNSGIFFGKFKLTGFSHDADGDGESDLVPSTGGTGPYNGKLEADRDDAISISWEAAKGVVLVDSAPIQWNLGTIEFDHSTFDPKTGIDVVVNDPDMNLIHDVIDTFPLDVYSDSDSGGTEVKAIETGTNTGIFRAQITFTEVGNSSGDRIKVSEGDTIFVKYVDRTLPKPSSKQDQVNLVAKSTYGIPISPTKKITQQNVQVTNSQSRLIDYAETGQQVLIQSGLTNNMKRDSNFTFIVQIKDKDDFVVNLSWISGSLVKEQSMGISQSWLPNESGEYTIETFVWESISNGSPISEKETLEFTVL